MRVRTKQRTLAQILDDTMGTAEVPVEVVTESPEHGELSALTVRIAGIFGRMDTQRRPGAAPRAGGHPAAAGRVHRDQFAPSPWVLAVAVGVTMGSPVGSIIAIALVAGVAWYLPSRKRREADQADAGAAA
jgi:hypothetical protein